MARSSKLLGPRRQYTVNQGGAPEPATSKETVVVGRQDDEKADEKPAAKPAPKS